MRTVYQERCNDQSLQSAKKTTFQSVLKDKNIAIHKPIKDQCDIFISFKEGQLLKEEYEKHILRKDQARIEKNKEKESASNTKIVITLDLQSKLLCPISLASSMYYKQKLTLHNFTLYELNEGYVRLYVR